MAVVDFFLKIDGIDGESTDDKHKGEIEVRSYSLGGSNAGSFASGSGGGGSGKVTLSDLKFTKLIDKSSPKLFGALTSGEHFKKATLVARKAGKDQQEFLTIAMTEGVLVSSMVHSHERGSESIPVDEVTLCFGKIEFKYKEQKGDGSLGGEIIAGYDVTKNKTS